MSKNKPFLWMKQDFDGEWIEVHEGKGIPLYTHPADLTDKPHPKCDEACMYLCKMRELTDEEIEEVYKTYFDMKTVDKYAILFARAILKKAQENV